MIDNTSSAKQKWVVNTGTVNIKSDYSSTYYCVKTSNDNFRSSEIDSSNQWTGSAAN